MYIVTIFLLQCIELENYQACSKIAALEGDILTAFTYQLKALHKLSACSSVSHSMSETIPCESTAKIISPNADATKDTASCRSIKRNTELFNRQAEKNLMESLENSVARSWTKVSTSRSLNNLQAIAQELYTFDCQGGLEELCMTRRKEEESSSSAVQISNVESSANGDEQREWIENLIFDENDSHKSHNESHKNIGRNNAQNFTQSICAKTMINSVNNDSQMNQYDKENIAFSDKVSSRTQRNYMINETIKALKFYLNSIGNEANILRCEVLRCAIRFWIEHDLPMQSLENVFLEHICVIYYPLGLLLFW